MTPPAPHSGPVDLTPDGTHVRLSLAKVVGIVAVLVGGAYVAGQKTTRLEEDLAVHKADNLRHLDKDFVFKHGVPVGAWDMDASTKAFSASIAILQAQAKEFAEWKAKQEAAEHERKPRWRP